MRILSQLTAWLDLLDQWRRTWFNVLDHWQALAAGLIALLAASVAVLGAEWFARRRDRREVAAIRASLAVEIQQFIDTLLRVREMIGRPRLKSRRDLLMLTEFHQPVVYPAIADRIGLVGPSLAKDVVGALDCLPTASAPGSATRQDPTGPSPDMSFAPDNMWTSANAFARDRSAI